MRLFRSSLIAACAAVLVAAPATLLAQFPAEVEPGSRVRIHLPETHRQMDGPSHRQLLRGTVESVTPDTLRLTIPGAFGALAIPRASMQRLEVSRGRPNRLSSATERAVGGAIAGALFFALTNDPDLLGGPKYRSDWEAAGVGAAWGAGFGVFLGVLFPHERWRRIRLTP